MSRIRLAATAAMLACGLMLVGGTGLASAQDGPRAHAGRSDHRQSTKGNKQFSGTYTIERFIAKGGKLYSVGTSRASSATRRSPRRTSGCRRPSPTRRRQRSQAHGQPGPAAAVAAAARRQRLLDPRARPRPDQPHVLGLVVRTNQIQLRIDAVQGPGNLLGNLLCGITGLLNPARRRSPTRRWPARPDPQRAARALAAHRITQPRGGAYRARTPRAVAGTLSRQRWSSSPASSPPGASTSATTSGRSSSTSRARIAADPGDLLHRRPARHDGRLRARRAAPSARATRRRCSSPPGSTPSAASSSARATCPSTPS